MCPGCFVTWIHPMIPPNMMMVGGSGVLYHLDSLMVTFDLLSDIYIQCQSVCFMLSRWPAIFTGRELSAQYDAVMWNESCSWMGVLSTYTVVWLRCISGGIQKCHMLTYLYVMVINNKMHDHLFQNMEGSGCVDLLATYRLIDLQSSISWGQKREMVWTGCCTLLHNKYCGNSVIDGVLESSLSVTIDYNLLCLRVCAFYK